MSSVFAEKTATLEELREFEKVLDQACGAPVAIVHEGVVVAYLVPAEVVHGVALAFTTNEEVAAILVKRRRTIQPVLDVLSDGPT